MAVSNGYLKLIGAVMAHETVIKQINAMVSDKKRL